ncbi:MAG: hypothetical protein OSB09_03680 [Planctomycetota bacterium]|nr:hypothetical protein [Planctomycetota bacterium]
MIIEPEVLVVGAGLTVGVVATLLRRHGHSGSLISGGGRPVVVGLHFDPDHPPNEERLDD